MRLKEPIAYLKPIAESASLDNYKKYLGLSLSALEKQIPKRPNADSNGSVEYYECWIECPDCGEIVPEYTSENETELLCRVRTKIEME